MDVGVRELKQHLSKYLKRVASGEVIRVTERGVPKAVLGPVPGVARLTQGISEGWVSPAEDLPIEKARPVRARRRIVDVLAEDRGD